MSFIRWGVDGSHVYIYDDVEFGPYCCGCILLPDNNEVSFGQQDGFATRDLDAMLAHIAEHRAAGHVVPDWVDQALRDEWKDEA